MSKVRITNGLGAFKDVPEARVRENVQMGWKRLDAKEGEGENPKVDDKEIKEELKAEALALGIEVVPQWGIPKLTEVIEAKKAELEKE